MPRIDLYEPWGVSFAAQSVKDSLMSHGEEAILLQMYHPNADKDARRCPVCWDEDYTQPEDQDCTVCYGTGFNGGIKSAARVWALFSDQKQGEDIGKFGVWAADDRQVMTEAFPDLIEHDYLVRVREWTRDHKVVSIEGYYICEEVSQDSIRTGNRFGQAVWDTIGQKAQIHKLSNSEAVTNYPVIGKRFDRLDGKVR